ncbi:hypothetical protein G5C51_28410 [Streptomyces sp. A7024]|uniref:Uncharacterized protein n=1 Tax=Streptomyces coryli TaxID=1128680 RepID=A0A6G4U740_9ACTN|nr:hypothetical protein [Streptomyces coryli]NGN67812.1 hypothetical protein [Streptomyces coryli]
MSNTDPQHPGGAETPAAFQQEVEELERQSATAARLFDIRRIIGWLFVVYGIIVTAMGISPSDSDMEKSQDININLWTGLAMLALGLFFLIWQHLRPVVPPSAEELAAAADRPDVH